MIKGAENLGSLSAVLFKANNNQEAIERFQATEDCLQHFHEE